MRYWIALAFVAVSSLMCIQMPGDEPTKDAAGDAFAAGGQTAELDGVVIAVGGWGSKEGSVAGVCSYFKKAGLECIGLDSAGENRGEDAVVADIGRTIDAVGAGYKSGKRPIILWGGSNGALSALIAASGRDDVDVVLATSPPLLYSYDKGKYPVFTRFDSNLYYVFGERDFTDEETAKVMVKNAEKSGKTARYEIIKGAGHEICCGDQRVLKKQHNFLLEILKKH
jgi:hypothetical protein